MSLSMLLAQSVSALYICNAILDHLNDRHFEFYQHSFLALFYFYISFGH